MVQYQVLLRSVARLILTALVLVNGVLTAYAGKYIVGLHAAEAQVVHKGAQCASWRSFCPTRMHCMESDRARG